MNAFVTFDTLDAVKKLRDAGFDERQAEEIVHVLAQAQLQLVSKAYVEAKFDAFQQYVGARFSLLQWMLGFNLTLSVGILWQLLR